MTNLNYAAAIELLYSAEKIVITAHINPDGDAIGSALALYNFAIDNGKSAHILIPESYAPENMKFLTNSNKVKKYVPELHNKHIYEADVIFMLDLNSFRRLKNMACHIEDSSARKVIIDHHVGGEDMADLYIVDTTASSTGELVYNLIHQTGGKISLDIAEAIYVAMMTDTGNFRFSNTNEKVLAIATDLVSKGVEPAKIYDAIYNQNSLDQIRLLGLAYSNLETFADDKISCMVVSDEMFQKTNTNDDKIEGYAEKTLSLKNSLVGLLIVELKEKSELRISLRSRNGIDVRTLAAKYDGGGHIYAAGCRFHDMTIEEAKQILIPEIEKII